MKFADQIFSNIIRFFFLIILNTGCFLLYAQCTPCPDFPRCDSCDGITRSKDYNRDYLDSLRLSVPDNREILKLGRCGDQHFMYDNLEGCYLTFKNIYKHSE